MDKKPLRVIIFGAGRSGTTALYTLVQEIILDRPDHGADFIYEPFLRDKTFFNGRYNDVAKNAPLIDSLSFEGIFNHLQLPLFINDPQLYEENDFLKRTLEPSGPGHHIAAKFIRANGRYPLLKQLFPDFKYIFITRNPADVVNSITRRFSFYGGEFHKDDYPRFIRQVNRLYGTSHTPGTISSIEEKELFFWEYSNRFALESIEKAGEDVLVICHEAYAADREYYARRICAFLETGYKEAYLEAAHAPAGPITTRFEVNPAVFDLYRRYLTGYFQLLRRFRIDIPCNEADILSKYRVTASARPAERPVYGLHGRAIAAKLKAGEAAIKKLEKELARLKNK